MARGGPTERYEKLGLRESLSNDNGKNIKSSFQYQLVCKEVAFILRNAYSRSPKNLQSLLFQDTLSAFRLLPEMQTQTAISAAHVLLQSAEAALPKQKRILAVTEFKHAIVAHKRRSKTQQTQLDETQGFTQLPHDILTHIFSFLDFQSLLCAAGVCRSWNVATSDNNLWWLLYDIFFGDSDSNKEMNGLPRYSGDRHKDYFQMIDNVGAEIDWRDAFKSAYKGISSRKCRSHRGYCKHCGSIVWVSNNRCPATKCSNQQVKPIAAQKIVEYILDDYLSESSSDDDSDSEDGSAYKLWAYPKEMSMPSLY